jgi:hypothetical protein
MTNTAWRAIPFSDTDGADSDGYLYIDIPNMREYRFISAIVKYEQTSDVVTSDRGGGDPYPTVDFMISTGEHGAASEEIHARFMAPAAVTSTVAKYFIFAPHLPWQSSDVVANYYYVPMPDFELSTSFRVRISGQPTTGAVDVIEVRGIVGQRDNKGHRA